MNANADPPTPLTDLRAGERAILLTMSAGKAVISRLTALGFTPGAELTMTQNYGRGPLIVTVRGTRVALGRGEAGRVLVARRGA